VHQIYTYTKVHMKHSRQILESVSFEW